jgi:hypothetical protein
MMVDAGSMNDYEKILRLKLKVLVLENPNFGKAW